MASKDLLFAWLKDAHGMEKALAEFGDRAKKVFQDHSEYQALIDTVIQKSNEHQDAVKTLLSADESTVSAGKDFIAKLSSFIGGVGSSVFGDDEVKDVLVLNGALHFANACYVSLAHGARTLGDEVVAAECERIAGEKVQLAEQILAHIPAVTDSALASKKDD